MREPRRRAILSRRVALGGAVIAIVGAATFFFSGSLRPPPSEAGSRPGVTLLVNHRPRIEVIPGTPLTFQVSLSSSRTATTSSVGSRWRPWHEMVRLEDAQTRQALPWATNRVGSPQSILLQPGTQLAAKDASAVISFGRRSVHTITYALGPDESAQLKPGTYYLRAAIETPFWLRWGWTGKAVSGIATVNVHDPAAEKTKAESFENERRALSAAYFFRVGRFGDAHRLATELIARQPKRAYAQVLLGDALAGLDRRQEAFDAYRRAASLLPRSYEPPAMLTDRIERLASLDVQPAAEKKSDKK